MIGKHLGNWQIERVLGRGGMGCVYLARHDDGEQQAAIKILAAELAKDAGFLQRFQREIEALRTLDHPHIVKLYQSGHENGIYYYVMEYVEGKSFQDILEARGRLPWEEVLDAALQICPALKHAHDHGIVHRDLKPPNLLRDRAGAVKLTDFGIAKVFSGTHLTAAGGVVGTAEYLSPEQAAGKPATRRSDVYSLGVVLYVLLTGRTPFEGESMVELLHKHCYSQFDRPIKIVPEIPRELDEIVCQLLEKAPDDRPTDCGVLGRQLAALRRKLERKVAGTDPGLVHDPTQGPSIASEDSPGPVTLMSRLLRTEGEPKDHVGALGRLFNRVWVLLPLFLLCVAGIAWAFWPGSPESLFQHGAALMAQDDPDEWDRAWSEYLQPLNESFPQHTYRAEVEKFHKQIETAHEARRFFKQGERLLREGNSAGAARIWSDLVTVFAGAAPAKSWVARAEKGLAELEKSPPAGGQLAAGYAALQRANTLRDQGQRAEAERIWDSLEDLYRNDFAARELLKEVRVARQKK
jgi:serine/threonine-protein kinase